MGTGRRAGSGRLDELAMGRALELARRGDGRVSPNPMVGAVVVRRRRIVGEGYHRRLGGPHAEVEALRAAGAAARAGQLFVTLEPCCHHGRTGPCTEAILAAGITRVVVAMRDPHSVVAGKGIALLRRRGLKVELGLGGAAARLLNVSYLKHVSTGLPWVTLKEAVSLDGRIALASGASRFITGPQARRAAMRLRLASDAVMVGIETVLADDPRLTARRGSQVAKPLVRAVLDAGLRTPPGARLLETASAGRICVFGAQSASAARRRALERQGASVVCVPCRKGRLDLSAVLRHLGGLGVGRLLVEGGGQVAASLVAQGLVDRVVYHVAPRLLGGDARAAVGDLGLQRLSQAPHLADVEVERAGRDLIVSGTLARPRRQPR